MKRCCILCRFCSEQDKCNQGQQNHCKRDIVKCAVQKWWMAFGGEVVQCERCGDVAACGDRCDVQPAISGVIELGSLCRRKFKLLSVKVNGCAGAIKRLS